MTKYIFWVYWILIQDFLFIPYAMNTSNLSQKLRPEHTNELKKKYTTLERTIKGRLTELLLIDGIGRDSDSCRGLSITPDFKIRELEKEENSKFISNASTIKNPLLHTSETKIKEELFDLIERQVDEPDVVDAYKKGIQNFFADLQKKRRSYLKAHPKFAQFLVQGHKDYKDGINVETFNVRTQVGKLLHQKFWDEAFETVEAEEQTDKGLKKTEILRFSPKSVDYLYTLFYNAGLVRNERGKSINQVFHDGDYPFIAQDIKVSWEEYIDVIAYLVERDKPNPHGKSGKQWSEEWAKKTSQFCDIIRALSNDQLGIHKSEYFQSENPKFEWDLTTQKLFNIGGEFLKNEVNIQNRLYNTDFSLSQRKKSLASCAEKIIEWKKINDSMGFRVSSSALDNEYYQHILGVSKNWLLHLTTSLEKEPQRYVNPGETISIKKVSIDNKWVLKKEDMENFKDALSNIVHIENREKAKTPYVSEEERKWSLRESYPDDVATTEKWETLRSIFQQFSGGKERGSNGSYKDFKLNITLEVKNAKGELINTKSMEVQFDDINNGIGLANFNIRNCERSINTQSRLSFDIPLTQARQIIEKNLKYMSFWAKDKDPKFSKLDFPDGDSIDISSFIRRDLKNGGDIDRATVKIINYFLQKGTFFLYHRADSQRSVSDIYLEKGMLTPKNLESAHIEDIRICTSLEVATQQHSYLQNKREDQVWIYIPERARIWWISPGDLIERINLWKVNRDKKEKSQS